MKTNEEYSKENRALRRDIKELNIEKVRMEKEITKLKRQLEEVESMVENLKVELLKAKTVNIGCDVVILAGNPCGLLRFIAEDDK